MAKDRDIYLSVCESGAVRITSLETPRFCVEAENREAAIELAREAFRYFDSVIDIKYVETNHRDIHKEKICA